MRYDKFRYLFPPRPKNPIDPSELDFFDNNTLIGQPKINGSNCVLFTDGRQTLVMNRHNSRLTGFNLNQDELNSLYRGEKGEWMVLNGEWLNKSKKDETGNVLNHKLVIFDILVYKSDYLVGSTFSERIDILTDLYGEKVSDKDYLYSISDNVYRVKNYESNFQEIFNHLSQIDFVEGLVLKRKNAKLEIGNTENNNTKSQIKCRKKTKLYKY